MFVIPIIIFIYIPDSLGVLIISFTVISLARDLPPPIVQELDGESQLRGESVEVGDADLNKNSKECPTLSPTEYSVSSLYLSPGWGKQLPPPIKQEQKPSSKRNWRPWTEEGDTRPGTDLLFRVSFIVANPCFPTPASDPHEAYCQSDLLPAQHQ